MMSKKSPNWTLAIAASVCAALSACGDGGTAPDSPGTPSTSSSALSTSTPRTTEAPDGLCQSDDVTMALGKGDGAAGSVYRPLLITNSSGEPCRIQGFPGVSYVAGDDGHQVGKPAERSGDKSDMVELSPGQAAAADVQFVNVHNYDPATCDPVPVNGLRIYLPQEADANFVPLDGTGCANPDIPGNQLTVKSVHRV
ncbi:hypothetical protein BS330_12680 [Amycolatopsis keratiniphila subsp. nogabecina]|nr:DUF4232 domain-containing protein [Amycolatopsis keratiniphila]OLZ58085.1 hypothetical protein BS330_12680 [Amycolatopsis keratiniphila subsp. nogabecina]